MSLGFYILHLHTHTHTAVKWWTVWTDGLYAFKALSLAPSLILFSATSRSESPSSLFIQVKTCPRPLKVCVCVGGRGLFTIKLGWLLSWNKRLFISRPALGDKWHICVGLSVFILLLQSPKMHGNGSQCNVFVYQSYARLYMRVISANSHKVFLAVM